MAKKKKAKKAKLSQAQQDQRTAAQLVKQQLAPTVAEIERQRKIAAADAAKRASFITAMTQTASEAAGQFAPKVQAAYNTAATDQTAFGKGYSDAFKQAQGANAEQTNKLLTQSGATEGQMAPGDTGAADALYGIAGAIPGSALSTEGAAFTSAAAKLPTTVGLMGQQYLSAAQGQDKSTMDDILAQLTQVQLKKPGLINDVVSQIQTNRSKSQQQAFENQLASQTLGLNTYKAESDVELGTYKANTDRAYKQGLLKLKKQGINISLAKLKQSAKTAGMTPSQWIDLQQTSGKLAKEDHDGSQRVSEIVNGKRTYKVIGKKTYTEALNDQVNQGVPQDMAVATLKRTYKAGSERPYYKSDLKMMSLANLKKLANGYAREYGDAGYNSKPNVPGVTGPIGTKSRSRLIEYILQYQG
jgi:hypothetical protein